MDVHHIIIPWCFDIWDMNGIWTGYEFSSHAILHLHYRHPILHHANIVGILSLKNIPYKFHHGNIPWMFPKYTFFVVLNQIIIYCSSLTGPFSFIFHSDLLYNQRVMRIIIGLLHIINGIEKYWLWVDYHRGNIMGIHRFWVNYNISLTWILRPFGDDFPY